MSLTAREGPIPGIWQYNLNDGTDNRAGRGRIAGKTGHLDVLRYATGYQPGTVERGLLEQFAATPAA
jgi:RPA family protein